MNNGICNPSSPTLKKGPPERSEGVLLSTTRRDNGIYTPSTPTLIKALSWDGAFFVLGRFEFTQIRTKMKKGPPERSEGVLLSTARRDNGIYTPSTENQ